MWTNAALFMAVTGAGLLFLEGSASNYSFLRTQILPVWKFLSPLVLENAGFSLMHQKMSAQILLQRSKTVLLKSRVSPSCVSSLYLLTLTPAFSV